MIFEEKVKFLRTLPQFKVIPISEVRAIAFAAKEADGRDAGTYPIKGSNLTLEQEDIDKIIRVYPDLEACLRRQAKLT
ncbi:MAG: hypothetical protein A2776_02450 [Candidatus Levybacteria bacterium RIFCSPHIGHO2_01_FULL_40_10]|nr:MAG: hypothetical protein A2776_02450 [Candidatus Levybacteria bacterium RIFCSPHIGHO2_01_FULL_40_10]